MCLAKTPKKTSPYKNKTTCIYRNNGNKMALLVLKFTEFLLILHRFIYFTYYFFFLFFQTYPELADDSPLPGGTFFTCASDDTIRIWNLEQKIFQNCALKRNIYCNVSFDSVIFFSFTFELLFFFIMTLSPFIYFLYLFFVIEHIPVFFIVIYIYLFFILSKSCM